MSISRITRRRAAIALGCLPFGGAARAARDGIELRYVIDREQRQPSGAITRRSFEGALQMLSGETREADVRDEYRIQLALTESGGVAHVRISLWDHQRATEPLVGTAAADVPIGGKTQLTLLASDNLHYPVTLSASRRLFP
jgi:hypothetical protein